MLNSLSKKIYVAKKYKALLVNKRGGRQTKVNWTPTSNF